MSTGVDIASLFEKCNDFLTVALNNAAGSAVRRGHYEVTIEHLMLACMTEPQSDIPIALETFGADAAKASARSTPRWTASGTATADARYSRRCSSS